MSEPTATNPQTGEKIVFRNGQWVPMTGAPASPAPQTGGPVFGAPPRPAPAPTVLQQSAEARAAEKAERDRITWEATHEPDGTPKPTAASGQATEQERKAGAFLIRALGSNESYEAQNIGPRSLVGQAVADNFPNVLNTLPGVIGNSPERQVADSAQDEFIAASLRQDSGAAIPPEEMERQRRIYFPMPGDGPEVLEQKRMARLRAIQGLRQSAGRLETGAEERYRAMVGPKPNEAQAGRDAGTMVGAELGGLEGTVSDDTPSPYDPGGPLNPGNGNPGGGRFMGQLGAATQNAVAGAAQGVFGIGDLAMDVSTGVQRGVNYAVGRGGEALLGAVGLPGAADWWRQGADANENALANTPSAAGAIEQLSPTPEGMAPARFTAQLLGGMAVPLGPKAVPRVNALAAPPAALTPAREVIDAGRQAGVRVMTSDVRPPTTFTGKIARATGERIPYAGTGGPRAAQQAERVEAVKSLARDVGADVSGELLEEVAQDFASTRGAALTNLKAAKDSVIDGVQGTLQPANVRRTLEAIDTQVRRLSGIDAEAYKPVIDRLTQFGANIASGKNLRQIEGNRALLGELFEDASLASIKGEGQKAINAIYGPLREDMGDFIAATAGNAARSRWKGANDRLSAMAGELSDNVFRGVLRSSDATPENVARLLFSKKPSEVQRLVGNLSPEGRRKAQAAVIQRAVERAGGIDNISPDRFANEVGRLGKSIGVVFDGPGLARVRGLERLLQATKQAGVASAAPPTGVQNSQLLMAGGVGVTGGSGAVPLAIAGGLARLYESVPVRNLLVGLSKTTPGSQGESRMLERIMKVVVSQSQIRGAPANDVLAASPGRLAAQDQERN